MAEERRLFPRTPVSIPVELINCLGDIAEGTITNLSEQGLLVAGDGSLAQLNALLPGLSLELSVCFRLRDELIRCDARIIYMRRRAKDCYELGLEFSWLDYFCRRVLREEVQSSRCIYCI